MLGSCLSSVCGSCSPCSSDCSWIPTAFHVPLPLGAVSLLEALPASSRSVLFFKYSVTAALSLMSVLSLLLPCSPLLRAWSCFPVSDPGTSDHLKGCMSACSLLSFPWWLFFVAHSVYWASTVLVPIASTSLRSQ